MSSATPIKFSEIKAGDRIRSVYTYEDVTTNGDHKEVTIAVEFIADSDAQDDSGTRKSLMVKAKSGAVFLGQDEQREDSVISYFILPKEETNE